MKFNLLNRRIHYWVSIAAALPIGIIVATGLLLQLKKRWAWVQPPEQRGTAEVPTLSFEKILAACRTVPQAGVEDWDDVRRIDVRPDRGMMKVWTTNGWEVQLDSYTGDVLQAAYRRSDTIEAIHDGSWFHDLVKNWVFLPAGMLLLALWGSGLYLFATPYLARAKARRLARHRAPPSPIGPAA